MDSEIIEQLREIIINSVGGANDLLIIGLHTPLVGNLLDSLAVNSLILGIEDYYGFSFDESDLSAESFETVETLANLIELKLSNR